MTLSDAGCEGQCVCDLWVYDPCSQPLITLIRVGSNDLEWRWMWGSVCVCDLWVYDPCSQPLITLIPVGSNDLEWRWMRGSVCVCDLWVYDPCSQRLITLVNTLNVTCELRFCSVGAVCILRDVQKFHACKLCRIYWWSCFVLTVCVVCVYDRGSCYCDVVLNVCITEGCSDSPGPW